MENALKAEKRKNERLLGDIAKLELSFSCNADDDTIVTKNTSKKPEMDVSITESPFNNAPNDELNEEILKLLQEVEASKKAYCLEKERCTELEEQLVATSKKN